MTCFDQSICLVHFVHAGAVYVIDFYKQATEEVEKNYSLARSLLPSLSCLARKLLP